MAVCVVISIGACEDTSSLNRAAFSVNRFGRSSEIATAMSGVPRLEQADA
jgi:hypothetical protein